MRKHERTGISQSETYTFYIAVSDACFMKVIDAGRDMFDLEEVRGQRIKSF